MPQPGLIEEAVTGSIIGAFYRVCNKLGFGFLEVSTSLRWNVN
jgi:hypothetical protein